MRYPCAILACLAGLSTLLGGTPPTHLTGRQVYVNESGMATVKVSTPPRTDLPATSDFLFWSLIREVKVGEARQLSVQGDVLPSAGFVFAEISPNTLTSFYWEAYDRHYHLIKTMPVPLSPFLYSAPTQ